MKHLLTLLLTAFVFVATTQAQTPQLLNYQGVARNGFGNALPNRQMTLRLSIRNGSSSGTIVYSETRTVTTNSGGLYSVQIGSGGTIATTGSIATINWQVGTKFLQVEVDPDAGTNFIDLGTTQLVSVPYAMSAGVATPIGSAGGDLAGTYPNPTIANSAVSTIKLADAAVTNIKLSDQSVTTTKLADASVTDAKIVTVAGSKVTGNISGNATNVTGTVAIANGGTGATTAAGARTNLGLGNVDNTSDLNKPISTATQAALDLKENLSNKSTTTTLGTSDDLYPTQKAVKTYVDGQIVVNATPDATATVKGKVQLAGDLTGTAAAPEVAAGAISTAKLADASVTDAKIVTVSASKVTGNISGNATNVTGTVAIANGGTGATTAAGARTNLGLGNVDNTSDLNKPISTATQAALDLKENLSNKSTATTLGTSDDLYPTQKAVKTYVDGQIVTNATPDATTTVKGKVQLAGDLTGTAAAPTVAAGTISTAKLADASVTDAKIVTVSASKVTGNISGNATNVTGTVAIANGGTGATTAAGARTNLGLGNVDNTSDLNKPISTATQAALDLKENLSNKSTTTTLGTSDDLYPTQKAVKTYVDGQIVVNATPDASTTVKGKVQLAGDLTGTAAAPAIAAGAISTAKLADASVTTAKFADAAVTTAKMAAGSVSTTTLADASVTDAKIVTVSASKVTGNISGNAVNVTGTVAIANGGTGATTAAGARTNLGLGNVDNTSDLNKPISTATQAALDLKENLSNKSTTTTLGTSDDLYPTQKAVKTYVDNQITAGNTPDATTTVKGKVQLAGDLTGTAASPAVATGAITTAKLADAAVTDTKIVTVSGTKVTGNISGNAANVTGTVAVANGGTGQTTVAGIKSILGLNGTKVAIGSDAGLTNQGNNGIAIGTEAGKTNQGVNTIAIGAAAGRSNQGLSSISIGYVSGDVSQGVNAIAIGGNTAQSNQADQTVAVGYAAGQYNQGTNAVAIGAFAGNNSQVANSIAINASGPSSPLNPTNAGLYINPIRTASATSNVLYYNASTKEVTYGTSTGVTSVGSIAGSSNANGATISGTTLSLTPADATNGGIITTSAQTIAGDKTFTGAIRGKVALTSEITANLTINSSNAEDYNSKILICNPTSGSITITFNSGLPAGFNCMVLQKSVNANKINIAAGSGITINNRNNYTATAGQYALATIVHIGSNVLVTAGDMQ